MKFQQQQTRHAIKSRSPKFHHTLRLIIPLSQLFTMTTKTYPTSPFSNAPASTSFTSLLSEMRILLATNFSLYDQHIELVKRGYLACHVMAAGVQHLLTAPAICELHQKFLEKWVCAQACI
jgi:hypothetical protein